MFNPNPNKVTLADELTLLLATNSDSRLVVDSRVMFTNYYLPKYNVYTYNDGDVYSHEKVFLCDPTVSLTHHTNIIFWGCVINVEQNVSVIFSNCTFVDCEFSGVWNRVGLSLDNTFKNCEIQTYDFSVRTVTDSFYDGKYIITSTSNLKCSDPSIFNHVKGLDAAVRLVPKMGTFVAYKAAYHKRSKYTGTPVIIQLEIPEDAERINGFSYKCRANKAKVLDIYDSKGNYYKNAQSIYHCPEPFIYTVGEVVYPDTWNPDFMDECSHGIHFFMKEDLAMYWISTMT